MTTNTTPPAPAAGGTTDPAGGAPGAPAGGAPAPAAGGAAPAPVEFALKAPDGVTLDPKLAEQFGAFVKEAKLDGAIAQKAADVFFGQQKAALAADEQRFTQQEAKWVEEISKDATFGGTNLAASRTAATKAVTKYGGEPLASLLKATGLDNNPVIFRTFAALGKAMGEDTIGGTGTPPPAAKKRDLQSALYPPQAP